MKKILLVSSALVATAGMMAQAQASEKIKLELGGYAKEWVGYASQKTGFQQASGTDYVKTDVKNDSEIWFAGSTKLDNGLQVGVQVQMVAATSANVAGSSGASDQIDRSYLYVQGGFGKLMLGKERNAAALSHISAPDVGIGLSDGDGNLWLVQPAAVTYQNQTFTARDGTAEKIMYFTPRMAGFQAGVSYTPSAFEDNRAQPNVLNNTQFNGLTGEMANSIWTVGLNYTDTLGPVDVIASLGALTEKPFGGYPAAGLSYVSKGKVHDYTGGLNLTYEGITLGGSARRLLEERGATAPKGSAYSDGWVYDIGVSYVTGPYSVSTGFIRSDLRGTVDTGAAASDKNDVVDQVNLSGRYNLGPGVDLAGTVMYMNYKDESGLVANSNRGYAGIGGLNLTF